MQCAPQVLRDFPREITPKKSLMPGCEGQNLFCSRRSRRRRRSRRWGSRRRRRRRRRGGREPIKDFWQPPPIHPGGTVALLKTTKNYKNMSTSKHLKRSKKYPGLLEEAGSLKKSDYSGSFLDLFVRFAHLKYIWQMLLPGSFCNDARWLISCNGGFREDGWRWWWGLRGDKVTTTLTDRSEGTEGQQGGAQGEVDVCYHPTPGTSFPVCHMSVTVFYRISHVWAWTLDAHCSPI